MKTLIPLMFALVSCGPVDTRAGFDPRPLIACRTPWEANGGYAYDPPALHGSPGMAHVSTPVIMTYADPMACESADTLYHFDAGQCRWFPPAASVDCEGNGQAFAVTVTGGLPTIENKGPALRCDGITIPTGASVTLPAKTATCDGLTWIEVFP